jgi:hypothetical protein
MVPKNPGLRRSGDTYGQMVPGNHSSMTKWFPHTVLTPGGSRKPVPGVLRVFGNHPAMNGSLTPFLDEAMVSSHRKISKWFPKTLSRPAKGFCEPPREERFPHTIHQRGDGFPIPYTVEVVPKNSSRDFWEVRVTTERRTVPSHHASTRQWFPHTVNSRNGSRKLFPGLPRVSVNHREKSGSLTPFCGEAMVSPYRTLSKWFPQTLPGNFQSFGEPPSDERFPHTIPRRGNGFLIPYNLEMVPENSFLAC